MKPFEEYDKYRHVHSDNVYRHMLSDLKTDTTYYVSDYNHLSRSLYVMKNLENGPVKVVMIKHSKQLYEWCLEQELEYKLKLLTK
jgi:hypothetical protein